MATDDKQTGPGRPPGFLAELQLGRLRWDLIHPFPQQDEADRSRGDQVVAELTAFLQEFVDPTEVDVTGRLPEGYHRELEGRGYFRLQDPVGQGGLGLSAQNAFRVVQAAASWSVPACYAMAVHLGLGAGAYLTLLGEEDGLGAELRGLLAEGLISGDADTEPTGAINRSRSTVAVPTEDGTGYLISGEKIFIQNGPIAGLLRVSATVREDGKEYIGLFFVDTRAPGFRVKSWHEYLGLKGLPNAALTFDRVFVPRERIFSPKSWTSEEEWRISPELNAVSAYGRMFPISAPATAIAKLCLHWSREFVQRRTAHGRGLDQYDEIQRTVATTAAEVFAIESVTDWCLLAADRHPGIDLVPERTAAKNITSTTCWQIVDRTVSLLAGEGFETARSKARRGAEPLPVERFFRDARALRIAGGVDFMVDHYIARGALLAHYAADADAATTAAAPDDARLTGRNRAHLSALAEESSRFAGFCRELTSRHDNPEELFEQERTLILLGRVSSDLFSMAAVLARASRLTAQGTDSVQELADVFCTQARQRIADAWGRLAAPAQPDHAGACAAWLHGDGLDFLINDVVTATPPATFEGNC
ncbi:acyl-CoA dehydrogenase family protein [Kitasatospora kazusensis]|uniref:Acyl-CoA dehydrogenase family protein n=1 Tax=Kitasatospora kazusensis TaxID=407974 RepID=A0ABN2ZK99_9ACTN